MAAKIQKYAIGLELMAKGLLDLRNPNIKIALFTNAESPDVENEQVFDDTNEVSDASYDAGGVVLENATVTRANKIVSWKADPVTFHDLSASFKYGKLYLNATVDSGGPDEKVKPLIMLVDFDDSGPGASLTIPGIDFVVPWHVDGILQFGPCEEVCA